MKLMKIVLAMLLMAALVTPAIAEDRLDLSGSMQVRAFLYDYDGNSSYDSDDDWDSSGAWNDQRLRIMGKINVADGVKVVFRFDATESDENSSDAVSWGGSKGPTTTTDVSGGAGTYAKYTGGSAYQYSQRRADIQFDLAYLELQKNGFTFQAGQNYFKDTGYVKIIDMVGAGFKGSYKGFSAMHLKRKDENAGKDDFSSSNYAGDASLSALSYTYKTDAFSIMPTVAYNRDKDDTDEDLFGFGLAGSVNAGPVLIKGEFDYFDGDDGGDDMDMKGTQLYIDASMAATDALRIGVMGFWADAQDGSGEYQVTDMNKYAGTDWRFAQWQPAFYGPFSGDFTYFSGADWQTFDPAEASSGVRAASLYADWKVNADVDLSFSGFMWKTDDSDVYDADGYTLNAGVVYKLMPNTSLKAQANYQYNDWKDDDYEEDIIQVISGLVVSF